MLFSDQQYIYKQKLFIFLTDIFWKRYNCACNEHENACWPLTDHHQRFIHDSSHESPCQGPLRDFSMFSKASWVNHRWCFMNCPESPIWEDTRSTQFWKSMLLRTILHKAFYAFNWLRCIMIKYQSDFRKLEQ